MNKEAFKQHYYRARHDAKMSEEESLDYAIAQVMPDVIDAQIALVEKLHTKVMAARKVS